MSYFSGANLKLINTIPIQHNGVNCYCTLLNHFTAFFYCKHECCMFTVTLQSMIVQEIKETFTFKVKIIEN